MKNFFRSIFLALFGFEFSNWLHEVDMAPSSIWFKLFVALTVILVIIEIRNAFVGAKGSSRDHRMKTLRNLCRIAFLTLLGFEICAYVHSVWDLTPDYTWFGLSLTLMVVLGLLEVINQVFRRIYRFELHWTNWAAAFLALGVDAGGDIFHFYSRWGWYDQLAHFFGAAMLMFAFTNMYLAYAKATRARHSHTISLMLAHGAVIMLGTWYEIEEYLEDFFSRSNRLGDGADTANDLLMNFFGATLVFLILYTWYRYHRGNQLITSRADATRLGTLTKRKRSPSGARRSSKAVRRPRTKRPA